MRPKTRNSAKIVCTISFSLEDEDGKELGPEHLLNPLESLLRRLLKEEGPAAAKAAQPAQEQDRPVEGGMMINGEEWVTPMLAASRLLPGASRKAHRSRATILLRLAQQGKLLKRQGEKVRPVYLKWTNVQAFYEETLPVIPAVSAVDSPPHARRRLGDAGKGGQRARKGP